MQETSSYVCTNIGLSPTMSFFNPIDIGGWGHDGPQNVFDHCAQTRRRRKLKLGEF